jgi:hypothetical protein
MTLLTQTLWMVRWAIVPVAIVLVLRYLNGRRVGEHPQCVRCGYDLFGLPPESHRCPECGSDLRVAGSSVVGRRIRRVGMAGTVAILAVAAWMGTWTAERAIHNHLGEVARRPIALMRAISAGDAETVAALLKADPRLAINRNSSHTPLQWAAVCNQPQIVRLLLDNGATADVNVILGERSALGFAADRGAVGIIKMLVAAGADPNLRDANRRTALHSEAPVAAEAVQALIAAGADPNLTDNHGRTPLHMAAASGRPPAIQALIKKGGAG